MDESAGGRGWGNGIKRIKKWKWKNVPVRDEIAACNFEKWKKRAGWVEVGWVGAAAWENYYYCCKNVKGTEHKASRVEGDAWSESTLSRAGLRPLLLDARHPGNGHILWLLRWYYYVVLSFGVKSFSICARSRSEIEGKYNFHRLARDNKAN